MAWMICDNCQQGVLKFESVASFIVKGTPIAQPRMKARAITPLGGKRAYAQVYEPGGKASTIRAWKKAVEIASLATKPKRPIEGPIYLAIDLYFPRPKYMTWKKYGTGPVPHAARPDRDNCEKAIMDVLQGIYFKDDSQVCSGGAVRKFYAGIGDEPHAMITIGVLREQNKGNSDTPLFSPSGETPCRKEH